VLKGGLREREDVELCALFARDVADDVVLGGGKEALEEIGLHYVD
jgi:hypothetical protein